MDHNDNPSSEWRQTNANLLSSTTFHWVNHYISLGKHGPLQETDIDPLPAPYQAQTLLDTFHEKWAEEISQKKTHEISLLSVLFQCMNPWVYIVTIMFSTIYWISVGSIALFLRVLLQYLDGEQPMSSKQVYYYAAGLSAAVFALSIVGHYPVEYRLSIICTNVKTTLTAVIFEKSFKIHCNAYDTSYILNLMVNDIQKFELFLTHLPKCFAFVVLITCLLYVAWDTKEWLNLLGLGVLILLVPILGSTAPQFAKLKTEILFYTERRLKLIKEAITGYLNIKMYQWETPLHGLVTETRQKEVEYLTKKGTLSAITFSVMIISESLVLFVIMMSNYYVYGRLYLSEVYPILLLYFSLKATLIFYIPSTIQCYYELKVSMKRIVAFLQTPEVLNTHRKSKPKMEMNHNHKKICIEIPSTSPASPESPNTPCYDAAYIHIDSTSFYWPEPQETNERMNDQNNAVLTRLNYCQSLSSESGPSIALSSIHLFVEDKELIAVTGPVATGKTALLLAILGELESSNDSDDSVFDIRGRIGYCSQVPWIFNGSVRENILFGNPYDESWYDKVIFACSLEDDFMELPHLDSTVIGERGVNLSGGQKTRINLARCVYSKPNILLLDDVLSSVDSVVQNHIFFNLLHNKHGLMKDTLRVLVTHQTNILHHTNSVIVMENGQLTTHEPPVKSAHEDLTLSANENDKLYAILHDCQLLCALQIPPNILHCIADYLFDSDQAMDLLPSPKSIQQMTSNLYATPLDLELLARTQSVTKRERSKAGSVSLDAYLHILFPHTKSKCVQILKLSLFTALMFIAQLFHSAAHYWLGVWSLAPTEEQSQTYYVATYVALVVMGIIFEFTRMITLYQRLFRGSFALHNQMFERVLYSGTAFYESNPIGRILNRFSQDQLNVDESLPLAAAWTVLCFCNTFMLYIVIAFVNPYLYFVLIPMSILAGWITTLYLKASRSLRRLEATTKSPIYSHFTQCFADVSTIRAYGKQAYVLDIMCHLINKNAAAYLIYRGCERWLAFRVDICIAICTTCLAFSSINLIDHVSGAGVGIALTYFAIAQLSLSFGLRQFADTENYMTSTERIIEYGQLKSEKETLEKDKNELMETHVSWPTKGDIHFKHLTVAYRNYLDPVLKDLSFSIRDGEKIGIVGRTGSGKSTIFKALFRFLSFDSGSIEIDGINICDISLSDLRKNMFIIPQNCTLFSSTLRYNLDPFCEHKDEELIEILKDVKLDVERKDNGLLLDSVMSEYGSNLSVGECQLICVCRALLNYSKNKILLIDEATANIDENTDEIIQNVFETKLFQNKTVLTIAHRINTIMNYDRILVLNQGKIVEFDAPDNLLKDTDSLFYSMYQKHN